MHVILTKKWSPEDVKEKNVKKKRLLKAALMRVEFS